MKTWFEALNAEEVSLWENTWKKEEFEKKYCREEQTLTLKPLTVEVKANVEKQQKSTDWTLGAQE